MKKPPFNAQLSRVNMKAANKFGFSKAILDIGKYPNMSPLQLFLPNPIHRLRFLPAIYAAGAIHLSILNRPIGTNARPA